MPCTSQPNLDTFSHTWKNLAALFTVSMLFIWLNKSDIFHSYTALHAMWVFMISIIALALRDETHAFWRNKTFMKIHDVRIWSNTELEISAILQGKITAYFSLCSPCVILFIDIPITIRCWYVRNSYWLHWFYLSLTNYCVVQDPIYCGIAVYRFW